MHRYEFRYGYHMGAGIIANKQEGRMNGHFSERTNSSGHVRRTLKIGGEFPD